MIPQIIFLILLTLSLGLKIGKHNEPRENHNAWYGLISYILMIFLLWWGGFFNVFIK